MPKTNIIQRDFRAGEISPRLEFQDQQEGRKRGVELMINWDVHLQGSAETSHGSEFVEELDDGNAGQANCKLLTFNLTPFMAFKVVLTPALLKVYTSHSQVRSNGLLDDPYLLTGLTEWDVDTSNSGSVNSLFGAIELFRGPLASGVSKISQDVAITAAHSYSFGIIIHSVSGLGIIRFGSTSGGSEIATQYFRDAGEFLFAGITTGTSVLSISIEAIDADTEIVVSMVQYYDENIAAAYLETATTIVQGDVDSVQAEEAPPEFSTNTLYRLVIASRSANLYSVTYTTGDGAPLVSSNVITDEPAAWANTRPNAIEFYGGRMWLGGCLDAPSTFWGSTTTGIFDFGLGSLDTDAIELSLDDGGLIEWISGAQGRGLMMGTNKGEHSISSSTGVLTPSDIFAAEQSTYGSAPVKAKEVGSQIIFVTRDGRKIRSTEFIWQSEVWKSRDLTYASEHITKDGGSIRQLEYAASPNSRIIALTKDGNVIQATYDAYTGTVGFSKRNTTGRVLCITVAQSGGNDELWWVVDRGDDTSILCLEKVPEPENTKLDSYSAIRGPLDGAGNYTTIAGGIVPHLGGVDCQVLVDGAVHPNITPEADGSFEIEAAGYEILIGIQVLSTIITLPVADTLPNVGTTRSMNKRFTEIWVKIVESWRPKINGHRPPNRRAPSIMGEVEPPLTENVPVSDTGWDMDAQITIEQDLPLKTELVGWFGRIVQEEI